MATAEDDAKAHAGQAVYSPFVLKAYDLWVLGLSNRFLWKCPTAKLRGLYDRNVSSNHLDIGVGTGYFLRHARWPSAKPSITLLDLNPNSLHAASQRIQDFSPNTVRADVLEPLPKIGPFQSVGLCYLLHCLPGRLSEKARLFRHVSEVMAPGARVFGATILQGDTVRSRPAKALMDVYNRRGIFSNANDDAETLKAELAAVFDIARFEISGCVAIFEASKT